MNNLNRLVKTSLLFITLVVIVFLLVVSLHLLIQGLTHLIYENQDASWLIQTLSNSFSAILFGVLLAIIVRSSSIVITITAALVAAGFPFEAGIFIVLGANMGTTIPSTLVSSFPSCHVNDHCHMMNISSMHYFNSMIAFVVFFPIQLSIDFLGKLSRGLVEWMGYQHNFLPNNHQGESFRFLEPLVSQLSISEHSAVISMALMIGVILLMRLFFVVLHLSFDGLIKRILTRQIEKPTCREQKLLFTGIWTSSLLQSSSSTLYILVPLVRELDCNNRGLYPLILGINVGTCITTILLALLLNSELALAIGLAHLIYNVISLLVFTFVPLLKEFPIRASAHLACFSYHEQGKTMNYPRYENLTKK